MSDRERVVRRQIARSAVELAGREHAEEFSQASIHAARVLGDFVRKLQAWGWPDARIEDCLIGLVATLVGRSGNGEGEV